MVVEIRTGRPLEEKGGFAKIAGGNSANYATSSQNAAAVTAYVEHAIARCIPFQQLEDGIKKSLVNDSLLLPWWGGVVLWR